MTTLCKQGTQTQNLNIYYRGRPLSCQAGERFTALLAQQVHDLTDLELDSVDIVLDNAADEEAFEKISARTQDLNGKRVLVVEGKWKLSSTMSLGIFLNAGNAGRKVEEIYYIAPASDYPRYRQCAEEALRSIEWAPETVAL